MPKLKPSPIMAACEVIMRNICAQCAQLGARYDKDKATKIGMSAKTFLNRMKNPRTLKLEELIIASLSLKYSMAWLVTDHRDEYKDES